MSFGFGKAPAAAGSGFGVPAPAAGGFGAPAAGGFGAPPAAGFGKAPAAGGFGAAAAPAAAGGFGKAPAPAAGGFGAPAAGGFGAPAVPAAGGFGAPAAPAAGGFGAPAAGGFGKAPAAAGGFGSFGGSAAGGFGASAPAAGGFGKMPAAAAAGGAPPAQLMYTGITGPGYTVPNTPNWMTGTDLSQITDETQIAKLPNNLKQHLGILLEFCAKERQAKSDIVRAYHELHLESNAKGIRSLQQRLDHLTTAASGGVDHLVVNVVQRDQSAKQLLQQAKETEQRVAEYTKEVWDDIQKNGVEYWQQKMNVRQGTSIVLHNVLRRIETDLESVEQTIDELSHALHPSSERRRFPTDGASRLNTGDSGAASLQTGADRFEQLGLAHGRLPGSALGTGDGVQLVQGCMQQALSAFLSLSSGVSKAHYSADELRDHVTRHYEVQSDELFQEDERGTDRLDENEDPGVATFTVGDAMRGGLRASQTTRPGAARGSYGGAQGLSYLPGGGLGGKRSMMGFDPQLEPSHPQGNVVVTTAQSATGAPGGFGAPLGGGFGSAAAPAAGGFGKQPVPASAAPAASSGGGFGAPAASASSASTVAGGAATTGAASGTAAAGASTAPSVGFAASAAGGATPGPAAPLTSAQGFGATPAPLGGLGAGAAVATPGTGQTPSIITPSLPGMSPSPAGPVAFGASPSPAPAASPDERPKQIRKR